MEKCMDAYPKLVNYLLFHSYTMNDVSLYHGKTGIVLAMMMYANVFKSQSIRQYTEDLFQTIYKDIHDGMPIGIEHGLAGVGYGITLLKQAKLIDCDLNNVLYDIDAKIMDYNPQRIKDCSFRKGLAGIFSYINLRNKVEGSVSSFDEYYLRQLSLIYHEKKDVIDNEMKKNLKDDLERPDWDEFSYQNKKLGLDQGSSYYLFKTYYDQLFLDS